MPFLETPLRFGAPCGYTHSSVEQGGTNLNTLFFGDNLQVMREHVKDEMVDLVYLDPPFNSKRDYNLLFATPKGHKSDAQITAFEDTWHWGEQAELEYSEVLSQKNTDASELVRSFRHFLGVNDLMAYLTMMANRLLELHRVLKPTGSLYLHCDPTASHYLKLLLDAIFGVMNFRNEIIWKRTTSHGNVRNVYGDVSDTIFFYTKSDRWTWNQIHLPYSDHLVAAKFRYQDPDGRRWQSVTLRNPGVRPNLFYPYTARNGITYQPHPNGWSCNIERMRKYDEGNRLHFPSRPGGQLRLKMYLDEMPGVKLQNVWTDIPAINSQAQERLGYPTQKPIALLERMIQASSNEGDIILDPFCGCGTAVHAADKLRRSWIGIDITHLAIALIEKRLKDAFPGVQYEVHGTPKDLEGARDLASRDKYQFQWWACSLVSAQPYHGHKKGADTGIDGLIFFQDQKGFAKKIIVSVKGGETVGRVMIADLKNSVEREKAEIGLFVTLTPPTHPMITEAVSAGFYESPNFPGQQFPRIQILTIEGLLSGQERARYPDMQLGLLNFRRAPKEVGSNQQKELFG